MISEPPELPGTLSNNLRRDQRISRGQLPSIGPGVPRTPTPFMPDPLRSLIIHNKHVSKSLIRTVDNIRGEVRKEESRNLRGVPSFKVDGQMGAGEARR
jgi:hypothetical protein